MMMGRKSSTCDERTRSLPTSAVSAPVLPSPVPIDSDFSPTRCMDVEII